MTTYKHRLASDVTAIAQDFENYGGDIVMLLANLHRAPLMPSSPYDSTRRRVREATERNIWRAELAAAICATEDSEERLSNLVPVVGRLIVGMGRHWLGDALDTYYTEVRPLPDPVAHVERLLAVAVEAVNRAFDSSELSLPMIAKAQHIQDRWAVITVA